MAPFSTKTCRMTNLDLKVGTDREVSSTTDDNDNNRLFWAELGKCSPECLENHHYNDYIVSCGAKLGQREPKQIVHYDVNCHRSMRSRMRDIKLCRISCGCPRKENVRRKHRVRQRVSSGRGFLPSLFTEEESFPKFLCYLRTCLLNPARYGTPQHHFMIKLY